MADRGAPWTRRLGFVAAPVSTARLLIPGTSTSCGRPPDEGGPEDTAGLHRGTPSGARARRIARAGTPASPRRPTTTSAHSSRSTRTPRATPPHIARSPSARSRPLDPGRRDRIGLRAPVHASAGPAPPNNVVQRFFLRRGKDAAVGVVGQVRTEDCVRKIIYRRRLMITSAISTDFGRRGACR